MERAHPSSEEARFNLARTPRRWDHGVARRREDERGHARRGPVAVHDFRGHSVQLAQAEGQRLPRQRAGELLERRDQLPNARSDGGDGAGRGGRRRGAGQDGAKPRQGGPGLRRSRRCRSGGVRGVHALRLLRATSAVPRPRRACARHQGWAQEAGQALVDSLGQGLQCRSEGGPGRGRDDRRRVDEHERGEGNSAAPLGHAQRRIERDHPSKALPHEHNSAAGGLEGAHLCLHKAVELHRGRAVAGGQAEDAHVVLGGEALELLGERVARELDTWDVDKHRLQP
mmetsp:Transcript_24575/g.66825  ORF Transcript_24575/g.66825 Transcript_24575/m.66825 type:complete len:285 (+) Transcript_24575:1497-2351(+)